MYKEDIQSVISPYHLTPQDAAPIRRPSTSQQVRALALPLTRISWHLLLFATVTVAFIAYWWVSNQLVTLGFALEAAQKEVKQIQMENRDQELAAMQEESFDAVSERIAELQMVAVTDVEYLQAVTHNVARR